MSAKYDPQLDSSATTWHMAMRKAAARSRLRFGRQRVRRALPGEQTLYGPWVVQSLPKPPASTLPPAGRVPTSPAVSVVPRPRAEAAGDSHPS